MRHTAHQSTLYHKHLGWTTPLPAQMAMFTFQITRKAPCSVLQVQMIGSHQGTLNLKSERITCKFATSNISFVHMFSKAVFPFFWLPSYLFYVYCIICPIFFTSVQPLSALQFIIIP